MSTEPDALRLRMMVRAFRAAKPSDEEVEAGVRRALSGLKRSQQRRRSRLLPIVVVAVLGLGTLAYARPSGFASVLSTLMDAAQVVRDRPTQGNRAMSAPVRVEEPSGREVSRPDRSEPELSPPPAPSVAPLPPDERVEPTRGKEKPASSAESSQRGASWGAVKQALDAGDTERALAALRQLGKSESPETRAKAAFGTAQLLWAKGYKVKACRIAESLSNVPEMDERTRERANALVENCRR
jgi:hypothetical protein